MPLTATFEKLRSVPMSEENTERLEGGTPFEVRVLRELANLNRRFDGMDARLTSLEDRLTGLEEKVDSRLRETRPIWEAVLSRLDNIDTRLDKIEARLERMDAKFDVVASELLDLRADVELLKKRPPAA
jgi:tetrahydromethanopterin S-methyltransferase subunit G